ncbi:MAG: hypothetical protein HYU97_04195 [Deltaproteobacteria bacterium]|nr:hypothetical protein [Deltaproteobacteria bacterium]
MTTIYSPVAVLGTCRNGNTIALVEDEQGLQYQVTVDLNAHDNTPQPRIIFDGNKSEIVSGKFVREHNALPRHELMEASKKASMCTDITLPSVHEERNTTIIPIDSGSEETRKAADEMVKLIKEGPLSKIKNASFTSESQFRDEVSASYYKLISGTQKRQLNPRKKVDLIATEMWDNGYHKHANLLRLTQYFLKACGIKKNEACLNSKVPYLNYVFLPKGTIVHELHDNTSLRKITPGENLTFDGIEYARGTELELYDFGYVKHGTLALNVTIHSIESNARTAIIRYGRTSVAPIFSAEFQQGTEIFFNDEFRVERGTLNNDQWIGGIEFQGGSEIKVMRGLMAEYFFGTLAKDQTIQGIKYKGQTVIKVNLEANPGDLEKKFRVIGGVLAEDTTTPEGIIFKGGTLFFPHGDVQIKKDTIEEYDGRIGTLERDQRTRETGRFVFKGGTIFATETYRCGWLSTCEKFHGTLAESQTVQGKQYQEGTKVIVKWKNHEEWALKLVGNDGFIDSIMHGAFAFFHVGKLRQTEKLKFEIRFND